jgi:hypothetical protein
MGSSTLFIAHMKQGDRLGAVLSMSWVVSGIPMGGKTRCLITNNYYWDWDTCLSSLSPRSTADVFNCGGIEIATLHVDGYAIIGRGRRRSRIDFYSQ